MNTSDRLPCPFCSWTNIRIVEEEMTEEDHCLVGEKYTYCWCKVCGAKGPTGFSSGLDEDEVISKCVKRWNEREVSK